MIVNKKIKIPKNPNDLRLESDLQSRFKKISQIESTDTIYQKNIHRSAFALITEKPVYQPGESVQICLFAYDKWTKRPLLAEPDRFKLPNLKLEIKDANDGKVALLPGKLDESVGVVSYCFKTDASIKGGFYKVEVRHSDDLMDKTKFFITSVRERRNAVTLDVNKDALVPNDEVITKVTLNMLTKTDEFFDEGAPGETLDYTAKIMDQNFNELERLSRQLTSGQDIFSFHTPPNLDGISDVIILVEATVEGERLEATRQISVKTLKDMFVRFVPSGGKYVAGFENEIYFACFARAEEKVAMAMNHGVVLERDPGGLGMEEEVASRISSNEDGRGKFRV